MTLEEPLTRLKEYSGRSRGRKAKILEGAPRHDLVVWDGDDPWCVIEVKSSPESRSSMNCEKDIERLKALVNKKKYRTINFGMFAYLSRYKDEDKYTSTRQEILAQCKQSANFTFTMDHKKVNLQEIDLGEARVLSISYKRSQL